MTGTKYKKNYSPLKKKSKTRERMQYYKVYFEGEEEEFAHRINIRTIHTHSYNDRWGKIHVKDTFVKNE